MSGAAAWADPVDGTTWIMVINEGLFYGSQLDHSLINPNQLRNFGIIYQDSLFNKGSGLSKISGAQYVAKYVPFCSVHHNVHSKCPC